MDSSAEIDICVIARYVMISVAPYQSTRAGRWQFSATTTYRLIGFSQTTYCSAIRCYFFTYIWRRSDLVSEQFAKHSKNLFYNVIWANNYCTNPFYKYVHLCGQSKKSRLRCECHLRYLPDEFKVKLIWISNRNISLWGINTSQAKLPFCYSPFNALICILLVFVSDLLTILHLLP